MSDSIPINPKLSELWGVPIMSFRGGVDDTGKPTGMTIRVFRCPNCSALVEGPQRWHHEYWHVRV